jgi:hypothetical protein
MMGGVGEEAAGEGGTMKKVHCQIGKQGRKKQEKRRVRERERERERAWVPGFKVQGSINRAT